MSKNKTKTYWTHKLDTAFSLKIRARGACERCGLKDATLQCAHIYSRSNRAVRWDELNAFAFCAACHFWAHKNPVDFALFVQDKLGKVKKQILISRAHQIKKWSNSELEELLKTLCTKS